MKYAVVLCDGMADMPVPELSGKTPMEAAKKPHMDSLAQFSEIGLCKTIPDGFSPGSDVANLSVMGYVPSECYTGRSPLEAASIGIKMNDTDVSLRCNLVTLSEEDEYENRTMVDYCAGDISTAEASELIKAVEAALGSDIFKFYSGVSYRHCLIWSKGTEKIGVMTPPHDITGLPIKEYLNKDPRAELLIALMKKSYDVLKNHPVNLKRAENGKRPANSIWLWGEGKKPGLQLFEARYGIKGSVISAVDLLKGIGVCAEMNTPQVAGATGYIDTNFAGKAEAAVAEFEKGQDYVYIHLEAPDECGHRFEIENKVRSIELIDEKIMPVLLRCLSAFDDYKILIIPDHPTPVKLGKHTSEPVPYMIFHKGARVEGPKIFSEKTAKETGAFMASGEQLMAHFLGK